jgi:ribose 5-phosphate isomerase A
MSVKKKAAAEKAVEMIKDGMVVGLGTGSTAQYAIEAVGRRVADGLDVRAVATSVNTEMEAARAGIDVIDIGDAGIIDITIDGADEVDPALDLVKGMGGALLREKLVASYSKQEVIVVDDSKLVRLLGTRSPLPIEVVPFGHRRTRETLRELGCEPTIKGGAEPAFTDNGNVIYHCAFAGIDDAYTLEDALHRIPGVVETGLFLGLATKVVVAGEKGIEVIDRVE